MIFENLIFFFNFLFDRQENFSPILQIKYQTTLIEYMLIELILKKESSYNVVFT